MLPQVILEIQQQLLLACPCHIGELKLGMGAGGASTVAELSVAGLPVAIVPLPTAPRQHQLANANELQNIGRAIVLDDAELSADYLERHLLPLLDRDRQAKMRAAVPTVDHARAAHEVAQLVRVHLQESSA